MSEVSEDVGDICLLLGVLWSPQLVPWKEMGWGGVGGECRLHLGVPQGFFCICFIFIFCVSILEFPFFLNSSKKNMLCDAALYSKFVL